MALAAASSHSTEVHIYQRNAEGEGVTTSVQGAKASGRNMFTTPDYCKEEDGTVWGWKVLVASSMEWVFLRSHWLNDINFPYL